MVKLITNSPLANVWLDKGQSRWLAHFYGEEEEGKVWTTLNWIWGGNILKEITLLLTRTVGSLLKSNYWILSMSSVADEVKWGGRSQKRAHKSPGWDDSCNFDQRGREFTKLLRDTHTRYVPTSLYLQIWLTLCYKQKRIMLLQWFCGLR